jgi:hypothetical protein
MLFLLYQLGGGSVALVLVYSSLYDADRVYATRIDKNIGIIAVYMMAAVANAGILFMTWHYQQRRQRERIERRGAKGTPMIMTTVTGAEWDAWESASEDEREREHEPTATVVVVDGDGDDEKAKADGIASRVKSRRRPA